MKPLKGGLTTPPRGGEHIILISCDWCGHYIQPFICDASQGVGWLNKYSLGQVRLGQGWLSKYSLGQLLNTRIQITIGLILESLYFMHNNTLGLWPQCYSIIYRPVHKSFHVQQLVIRFHLQGLNFNIHLAIGLIIMPLATGLSILTQTYPNCIRLI